MILDKKRIKEDNPVGWKGVFASYPTKKMLCSFPFIASITITVISAMFFILTTKSSYILLIWFIDLVKGLFPNLLGFCLGGYAILIGFGNTNLLKSMTTKIPSLNKSLFQFLSGIFAFALILQSISLILSLLLSFVVQFDLFSFSDNINKVINIIVFCILSIPSFWAIFILPNFIVNVFTFGQLHHFRLTLDKIAEEKEKEKGEN